MSLQKQYQGLDKVYEFNKKEGDETINNDDKIPILKRYNKSTLINSSRYSFYK